MTAFIFLLQRSEKECNIALLMHALIAVVMALHRVKKLVNISRATSQFTKGDCEIFETTWLQFDDRHSFGTLAFRKLLEYRHLNFVNRQSSLHYVKISRNSVK